MLAAGGVVTPRDGRRSGPVSLDDVYAVAGPDGPGRALMSGIQALVRAVLEQRRLDRSRGLDTAAFVSGYEGSPLGGLDLELGRAADHLAAEGVIFSPGLNEELAATAVAGTQLVPQVPGHHHDGVTGWWYGKNPGLDRAADAIRHGNYAGTTPLGGAVAIIGDDPACKSSTLPSSSWAMARSLCLPLLSPGSVCDVVRLGLHAVALSRATGLWAGLQIVAEVADASGVVDLDVPPVAAAAFADRPAARLLLGSAALEAEADLFSVRLPAVLDYARAAGLTTVVADSPQPRLAVVAAGTAFAAVRRATEDLGLWGRAAEELGLRLIRVDLPWPLDGDELARLTSDLDEVLVVEGQGALHRVTDEGGALRPPSAHHGSAARRAPTVAPCSRMGARSTPTRWPAPSPAGSARTACLRPPAAGWRSFRSVPAYGSSWPRRRRGPRISARAVPTMSPPRPLTTSWWVSASAATSWPPSMNTVAVTR